MPNKIVIHVLKRIFYSIVVYLSTEQDIRGDYNIPRRTAGLHSLMSNLETSSPLFLSLPLERKRHAGYRVENIASTLSRGPNYVFC
jgi:hypothetical protein